MRHTIRIRLQGCTPEYSEYAVSRNVMKGRHKITYYDSDITMLSVPYLALYRRASFTVRFTRKNQEGVTS